MSQLFTALAPHECLGCGNEGNILCDACLPQAIILKKSTCWRCNTPTKAGRACKTCQTQSPLGRVVVASHYGESVELLIKAIKYHHHGAGAKQAGRLIARSFSPRWYDLVTWVPSSPAHYRARGYNQAELIAREVAKNFGLPYCNLLVRLGNQSQVGTNREQRLSQLENAFAVRKRALIRGNRILIIDDVLTTGSTLNECAQALIGAGAKRVHAAVVAKH